MAHDEIRVNKSREDQAIDTLVNYLDDLGGCRFLFAPEALHQGVRELIRAELKDFEEACQEKEIPICSIAPEDADERELYENRLTECALHHFHEQAPEKFRLALAELIQESLAFAQPIYRKRCGANEEIINEGRPSLSAIQQNVLRRSILRLKSLAYRRIDGIEDEENNEKLLPITRASAEIYNHLAFWTYDHVRVAELLKDTLFSLVKGHSDPDKEAAFFANEAAEFVWDNIDGAIQAMVNIVIAFALKLSKASAIQRHRHLVPRYEVKKFAFSSSDLEEVAKRFLRPWFENLSVKLEKTAGRRPKTQELFESEEFRSQVIEVMLAILDEPEDITQYRVARKLNLGNPKNKRDRTLYNKLQKLKLDWKELKIEAKRIRRERQSAQ